MLNISIDFGYKSKTPLVYRDVDIRFDYGDIVNIVGENGCGKSTFYKVLMGKLPPLAGVVSQEITNNIVVVSDYVGLPDECQVGDIINFIGSDRTAYMEATFPDLHKSIKKMETLKTSLLSTGQHRLLEIYCALSTRKSILILDEASNGLDLRNRQLLLDQIKLLVQSNQIIVFNTTHHIEDVVDLGGDVYIMNKHRNVITKYLGQLSVERIRKHMKEMIKDENTF